MKISLATLGLRHSVSRAASATSRASCSPASVCFRSSAIPASRPPCHDRTRFPCYCFHRLEATRRKTSRAAPKTQTQSSRRGSGKGDRQPCSASRARNLRRPPTEQSCLSPSPPRGRVDSPSASGYRAPGFCRMLPGAGGHPTQRKVAECPTDQDRGARTVRAGPDRVKPRRVAPPPPPDSRGDP